ncbi:hypothetical protein G7Y89_g11247 [Cudoniella acicularis]|uniref:Heterokaryon incompatibility domain-containing protein n=1 Tax=Cudoniella acicularis TaxID=354080 RepID=A0A8H4VY09_9HELO|nr:hypothetical protein G7Y89_g11247 [Cudoniella acicularis]
MDAKFNIQDRLQAQYHDKDFRPRVHAELNLLEYFHMNRLPFVDDDRFIGCSKPACYCCYHYISLHPGGFVRPSSHGIRYLNWRPPDLVNATDTIIHVIFWVFANFISDDAILVTRMLGERYLWVDAVCIKQDDPDDVAIQIKAMGAIYKASTITIVNADGRNAHAGLPGVRPGSRNVKQLTFRIGDFTWIATQPPLGNLLGGTVWSSRAWTYQEGLFSRRKLIFVAGLAYYQCVEDVCTGTGSYHIISIFTTLVKYTDKEIAPIEYVILADLHSLIFSAPQSTADFDDFHSLDYYFYEYNAIVDNYTARSLGIPTDILLAFRGIESGLGARMGSEFLWGLPIKYFDLALLWLFLEGLDQGCQIPLPVDKATWRLEEYAESGQNPTRRLGTSQPFPSWAWCGWNGRAAYNISGLSLAELIPSKVQSAIDWPWRKCLALEVSHSIRGIANSGILEFETSVAQVTLRNLHYPGSFNRFWDKPRYNCAIVVQECILLSKLDIRECVAWEFLGVMLIDRDVNRICYRKDVAVISEADWISCQPRKELIQLE